MKIAATQYNLEHKALEIYLSGCKVPHCPGCHNPELWDFSRGTTLANSLPDILAKIERDRTMIDKVWILGGEPIDQDEEQLTALMRAVDEKLHLCLFTRYDIDDIPVTVKYLADSIKTGPYIKELACDDNISACGIKLASSNQRVYVNGVDY